MLCDPLYHAFQNGNCTLCSKLKTSWKSVVFTNKVGKNSRYLRAFLIKKLFYSECDELALSTISYPTRTRGIIVNYLTIGSRVSVRMSRYETRGKFGEHERKETLASWVLSKLLKCFISRHTHSWNINQLFYNISMQSMRQLTKSLLLY